MAEWDWVEVVGPTVEKAVEAAVDDLGLESADAAEIEVLQEPKGGFLGLGGQDAVVRVRPKPKKAGRRRRRGGRGRDQSGGQRSEPESKPKGRQRQPRSAPDKAARGKKDADRGPRKRPERPDGPRPKRQEDKMEVEVDRNAQAEMVKDFLTGLLDAFGIDGDVVCRVEEDVIYADVTGELTEALVGPKGAILQATHELCRTIVQRKSQAGARIRLDIAGYVARRREALRIYTGRLVEKVVDEGGEIMLEPMNAADRKVVHDAAAELGGVRTYSEGEEPRRSVVIAKIEDD